MNEMKKNQEQKSNGKGSGIGAFVGAVTGMFAGTAVQAEAAEVVDPINPDEIVYPEVVIHTSHTDVTPEPDPDPEPEPDSEPQFKVLSVETVVDETGQEMTVAEVVLEGNYGQILDADHDGVADFIGVDFDGDGYYSQSEVEYIGDAMISMDVLQQAAENTQYLSDLNGPDYVNDANVGGFA